MSKHSKIHFFVFATLLSLSPKIQATIPGVAPQSKWAISGHNFLTLSQLQQAQNVEQTTYLNRLKLNYNHDGIQFESQIRNQATYTNPHNEQLAHTSSYDPSYFDLTKSHNGANHAIYVSQIERLNLKLNTKHYTLQAGRTRLNWGVNQVWNLHDIFQTNSIHNVTNAPDLATDAIRLNYNLGINQHIETIYTPKTEQRSSITGAQYFINKNKNDYQLIVAQTQSNTLAGFAFTRDFLNTQFQTEFIIIDNDNVLFSLENTMYPNYLPNLSITTAWLYIDDVNKRSQFNVHNLAASQNAFHLRTQFDLTPLSQLLYFMTFEENSAVFSGAHRYSLSDNWFINTSVEHTDIRHKSDQSLPKNTISIQVEHYF